MYGAEKLATKPAFVSHGGIKKTADFRPPF
jgi:hypothetical protein